MFKDKKIYPLPVIEEALDKLEDGKVFTAFDSKKVFFILTSM